MNKKLLLFCLAGFASLLFKAQTPQQLQNYCGTGAPPQEWDTWLNSKVEEYKKNMAENKSAQVVTAIPTIVHIIYFNEVIGTYPNLDSNQVKAQIAALNRDFGGTGVNVNKVPSYFANRVANTGIQFCLAQKDRQDQPMVPYGIDRISAAANSWQSPGTPGLDLQNYFNTVVIPATIWDPTKYFNIWVSDKPPTWAPNGFATYPPAPGITGVFGGQVGTANNDGVWIYAKAFGDAATGAAAPFDEGRTGTHEVAHWLGLRHIWGDGNCLSDYCSDTPAQPMAHTGCVTVTPVDQCGVGTAPNGAMPMNFMDMTDDACKYMFTHDQSIRMNTALSQSPLRYQLGTHNKCLFAAAPSSSAVASFVTNKTQCLNKPFTPFNTTSGYPFPTYVWSSQPAAVFAPNNAVSNPAITLSNPGTYTITLVATNSLSSSTATFVVSAQNTCAAQPLCLDSLRMIRNIDTLNRYAAPTNTQIVNCGIGMPKGYMVGTNCYKDKEFAQYFPPSTYTSMGGNLQINSAIVFFDSLGTKSPIPGTQVKCKVYGGSVGMGPGTSQGSKSESINTIITSGAVTDVTYLGKPSVVPASNNKYFPFKFDFTPPIVISTPNVGFFVGVEIPQNIVNGVSDSVSIMTNTKFNTAIDSSAWYFTANLTWRPYKSTRAAKIQMAIMPIITCGPVGIKDEAFNEFNSNVNIMPNPNNGEFNFVFSFKKEQALSVIVYNAMGQQVSTTELKHIMNNMISFDLSDKPTGIYFAEVSNGTQKVVRKIVISH